MSAYFVDWAKRVDNSLEDMVQNKCPETVATTECELAGIEVRVFQGDSSKKVTCRDFNGYRINLEVRDGIVVRAYRG